MTASLMPNGKQQFFNSSGNPLAGGRVYTYAAGTTTNKDTYTTAAASVQNANPVVLDARGEASIFWRGSYNVVVKDASDNLIYSTDNYTPSADVFASSSGSELVGFLPSGAGAVVRTLQSKGRDAFSVNDFAPVADGVGDDSPAFSLAAKAAVAVALTTNTTVTTAQACRVHVPAGTYKLNSFVDAGGRAVDWILDDGVTITNIDNLGGRIVRGGGLRIARPMHYGCFDTACSSSITANYSPNEPPAVAGIGSDAAISTYASRDSVAQYVANTAPALLYTLAAPTYTATTVTCPTPVDPKKMRVGMIIDTAHATKYSGFVTGWAADGSSITVSAWYLFGGGAGTPSNGVNAYVNPITKIWAHNAGVTLNPASYGDAAAGFELDVYNSKADSNAYVAAATGQTWGFDAYAAGSKNCSAGHVSRGYWLAGYVSDSALNTSTGFVTKGAELYGFSHESTLAGSNAFRSLYGGLVSFNVSNAGTMDLGRQDAATSTIINLHSSGNANAYDSRIVATGGAAGVGLGTIGYTAAQHNFNGPVATSVPVAVTAKTVDKTSYVSGNSYFYAFSLNGVTIGNISGNGSTTTYATSSDYRLKWKIAPIVGAWERLKAYKPCEFEFKSTPGVRVRGFLAHELAAVCDAAVVGEKDATKIELYEVEPEKTVPCIKQRQVTKAIQQETPRTVVELVDGRYVQTTVIDTTEVQEFLFDSYPVWNSDGSPVMEVIKPAVTEEINALGEILVPASDAVFGQRIIQIPVMEDYEDFDVIPAVMGEREVPDYQGIDPSKTIADLMAALQEAIARIEALESRMPA